MTVSSVLTIVGFAMIWPIALRAMMAFAVIPAFNRDSWSLTVGVARFASAFGEVRLHLSLLGLFAGSVIAFAGWKDGKPPYWIILLVAGGAAVFTWFIMNTGPDEMGLRPLVAFLTGIAVAVSMMIWGMLTRLIWKAKSR